MNGIATASSSVPMGRPSTTGDNRKPGSIALLVSDIIKELEDLDMTINIHESRIQPALTPVPPENSEKGLEDGSPTDLGRSLTDILTRIRRAKSHLYSITSRVEL
jgi:hypothetical protein